MTSAISNKVLKEKCIRYILSDTARGDMDALIEDALITASREIADLGGDTPLVWNREVYDEIFTRYYAVVSDITAADPGVITADSVDPDLSSDRGFQTNDIVYLGGVNGENSLHRLNQRLFRAVRIDATTLSLKTLDGQSDIDTTDYEEYDSGGTIYHAGIVLPRTTIEAGDWDIKRVYGAYSDTLRMKPISEEAAAFHGLNSPGGQPSHWRYQQYAFGAFTTVEHFLFWYPYVGQRYTIKALIEKAYPDLSTWTAAAYPPHPPHIHDFVWHRALSNLATHGEKQRRRSAGKEGERGDNTKIEILNAHYWISKAAAEEIKIMEYSRKLDGDVSYLSQGMGA